MRERPILFSGPMVRAILEGRKTQTRWVMKPQPVLDGDMVGHPALCGLFGAHVFGPCAAKMIPCPYGAPGDRLWVRETWAPIVQIADVDLPAGLVEKADPRGGVQLIAYRATTEDFVWADGDGYAMEGRSCWRPSIHMPRWASRLLLEVTEVRVQRLQEISEEDARAEGVESRGAFCGLWDTINGNGSWRENPWVWCVSFRRVEEVERD
jgi:hypothetical protein